jgi:cell division protease FtsH
MSQDQNSRDENRYPRFGNKPNGPGGGNDPNQPGKKSPKFNGYWIYFIILAVLIGFNFFGALSPNAKKITQNQFYDLLKKAK